MSRYPPPVELRPFMALVCLLVAFGFVLAFICTAAWWLVELIFEGEPSANAFSAMCGTAAISTFLVGMYHVMRAR